MIRKIILGLLLLLMIAGVSAAFILKWNPLHPLRSDTVIVDSLSREFSYYLPANISAHPRLIFVLHGSTGSPAIMQVSTGHEFDRLAEAHGDAIIVYPAGYHGYWNDCRKKGTYESKKLNLDDVAYFGKMIDYFKVKYQIDTAAVFAMGFSNGGHMCYKLAKEKPQWFRGIAAVSASLPVEENNDCYDLHLPISVLVMNGTGDPINPYIGGEVIVGDGQKRGAVVSTDQTIEYWRITDSCDVKPHVNDYLDINGADSSTVTSYLYVNNTTGKKVELVKVINGGHIVPNNGFSMWPKGLGRVNKDINAPEVIWDFFNGL